MSKPCPCLEPWMLSYLSCVVPATSGPGAAWVPPEQPGVRVPWVIAVGAGDAADPSGGREDSALTVAGARGGRRRGM